ncbi:MAG: hypothetical protein ABIH23_24230 [bacterium]
MDNRLRKLTVSILPFAALIFLLGCGNNPDKAFERAIRAWKGKDWIGASLYAQEFINRFPEDPRLREAYNLLVNCHLSLQEWSLARSVCGEVVERFPDEMTQIGAQLVVGRTYLGQAQQGQEGDFNRALAIFSEIADSTADIVFRLRAIQESAITYEIMAGQIGSSTATGWKQAISAYDDWLALASIPQAASEIPNITSLQIEVLQQRGGDFAAAGEFRKGAEAFATIAAATRFPDLKRAEWSLVRSQYLRMLHQGPDPKTPLTPEGRQELIESYEQTVQNFSDTDYGIWARVELCKLYKPVDPDEAETCLKKAIEKYQEIIHNPVDLGMPGFYSAKIGDAYYHVEDLDRAEEAFKNLRDHYVDQWGGYADAKLADIQKTRGETAGMTAEATGEIEAATGPQQGGQ